MPTIFVLPKYVFDNIGFQDIAFVHDFSDDDISIRIRRAGFKLMFCSDTWICHDHDFRNMEDKDPVKFQKSLDSGRAIFREKYHGIDAWDDINNFEFALLSSLDTVALPSGDLRNLVIDSRCGTPLLEIRNKLRKRGKTSLVSYTFTTQAKFYFDLQSIANDVRCDRIDYIQSYYADATFDIVTLCEPINTYPTPITLLQKLYNFLRPSGILFFKLRNTDDFHSFLRATGIGGLNDDDLPASMPPNEVLECLKLFGANDIKITNEVHNLTQDDQETLFNMLKKVNPNANKNDMAKLLTREYVFMVVKTIQT